MGVLDFLFEGSAPTPSTSSTSTQTQLPEWYTQYTTDMLGRTVKVERPASGGGTAVSESFYNSLGQFDYDNNDNWLSGLNKRIFGLSSTVNTAGSRAAVTTGTPGLMMPAFSAAASFFCRSGSLPY